MEKPRMKWAQYIGEIASDRVIEYITLKKMT